MLWFALLTVPYKKGAQASPELKHAFQFKQKKKVVTSAEKTSETTTARLTQAYTQSVRNLRAKKTTGGPENIANVQARERGWDEHCVVITFGSEQEGSGGVTVTKAKADTLGRQGSKRSKSC